MDCSTVRENIGAYLDGELTGQHGADLKAHIGSCPACAAELARLQAIVGRLGKASQHTDVKAPSQLWPAIEQRLAAPARRRVAGSAIRLFRRPLAAAASLAVLIGAGALLSVWLSHGAGTAQATTIDYALLLDGLAADVDEAVQRFFAHYKAEPIEADAASAAAPRLHFAIPPELPGGFRREQAYRLQFGASPGIAARYRRGHEPLVLFFHLPANKQHLGVHRQSQCVVAGRHGHRVEVGPWQLVHFTDPTTCHCLLSRLDRESDLLAVLAAIAPDFAGSVDAPH